MAKMLSISADELQELRERTKRLAMAKSHLQLVYDLIAKLGRTPGLEDTTESIARLVCDTIGGSNAFVYYEVDDRFHCIDAFGRSQEMDTIDDEMVREAFEAHRFTERPHDFQDTRMTTPEFTEAFTWAAPLMVGDEALGVLKIEDTIVSTHDAKEQFDAFFGYAALVLKNEIHNYAQLREAYRELSATSVRLTEEVARRMDVEANLRDSRDQLETEVMNRTRALLTLSESNQTLMRATDEAQLLRDVCRVAVEVGGYRLAWVGFVENDEEKSIRPVASAGEDEDYLEHIKVSWGTGPEGLGPSGRSVRERKPVISQDMENDPDYAPWRAEAIRRGYRSSMSLPLSSQDGTVFGNLAIYADEPDAFDDREKRLLFELAGDLSYGIEALRERQRRAAAEKQARDAAIYSRTIIEAGPDPLVAISLEGKITDVNQAAEEATGVSRDHLIGSDFAGYVATPDEARAGFHRVIEEGFVRDFPLTLVHASGQTMEVQYSGTVYRSAAGEPQGVLVTAHDVTEAKRVQAQVSRLAAIVTSSQDAIFTKSLDDIVTSWNAAAEALYGYSPEEMIGAEVGVLAPPERADEPRQLVERICRGERIAGFETQRVRKDGSLFDISLTLSPILDGAGDIAAVSVLGHDITVRKHAEEALRGSEEKYRTLLQKIEAAVVVHGTDTQIQTSNSMAQELLGLTEDQILGKTVTDPAWHFFREDGTAMPPEEHPAARVVATRRALKNYVIGVHRPGREADTDIWILANADPVLDTEGEFAQVIVTFVDISDRRHAEEALHESEQRYRDIFDHSVDTLYLLEVTEDGRFRNLEVNAAFEASTGLSREQVIGKFQEEVVSQEQADIVNTKYRHCVEAGVPIEEEVALELPSGRHFYHSTLIPLLDDTGRVDRILGISRDITERRRAEEALRTSQRKLALHLEQTLLGVIEFDMEFRVREWNPAAEAIFGYTREEAIGRRAADLIVPEKARPQVDSLFERLMQRGAGEFNTNENVTKDGKTILCEWINTPLIDDSGTAVGIMALARDITESRRAEELRIAKEAAEAASVAKSAFLANMSHEIRTPMNAILGFSQLMRRDKDLSARQRQQLDIINGSGEHLLALINDVLEMSKIEAGRISANLAVFDLRSLLVEVDSLFGLRAQAKGLVLRIDCSDDVPRFVVTDENKLRQVLVNLLGNAVKFTDEGSVELHVRVERDEDGQLRLIAEVTDTGRGIPAEDMSRLFHYFEQTDAGRRTDIGTGLGLAISREFVHLLGGEITGDSHVGVGSVFTFDIKIEEAEAQVAARNLEGRRVAGLCPGEPRYRVLVADDAPDNRELLVQLLEPAGFSVRSVSNGKEALREFEEWHPQLILMDMRMPVMDGYEATRRIRTAPDGADVAIIGVTASAFAEMRQGVFDAGVDEFLTKPFHQADLFDQIGKLLDVHYVYEERPEKIEQEAAEALDPAAIAALPGDLISRLRRATVAADFNAVLELADEVGGHDDRGAAALRTLAERFDSERILAALPREENS